MSHFQRIYSKKNRFFIIRAFSLVELLIAVGIFSVVSIAIYSAFFTGSAVLRRINNFDLGQQKILLKTERLSRELREQCACRKQLFQGDKTRISFCANIDYFPSRLTYYFDSASLTIKRVADRLNDIIDEDGKLDPELHAPAKFYLTKVKEVSFSYLYLDLSKNLYLWKQEWKEDALPLAVKFIITGKNKKYESTVYLPRN
ncbi:MAG: hypothetical protein COV71_06550 [Candidatus Omnitrophica bacterium CG11_big_fil_rev_8_21_14_0_20_41_12]|nr:MAG: hypothetical protein COV71_06550 [Candidatus Omnitrophica bacterium CG11_big_fil_rev_8_21_14_0_20_41_12]